MGRLPQQGVQLIRRLERVPVPAPPQLASFGCPER